MRKELKEACVIEVEEHLLKVARLSLSNQKIGLKDFFVLSLPLPEPGKPYQNITEPISSLIKNGKIPLNIPFIICLGPGLVTVKKITLPLIPKNELKQAISWTIQEELSFPMEKAGFEYAIISERKDADGSAKLDLLVFIVEKAMLDAYTEIFKAANLIPQAIVYSSNNFTSLMHEGRQFSWEKCNVLVDVGYDTTSVSFFKDKQLVFSRNVSLGARNIIESIKGAFLTKDGKVELGLDDAERIVFNEDLFPGNSSELIEGKIPGNQLLAKVRSVLEDLAEDISRSLVYFKVSSKADIFDKLYVSGYGLRINGVERFLAEFLGLKIERLELPLEAEVDSALAKEKDIIARSFNCITSSLSLNTAINFLPDELRLSRLHILEDIIFKVAVVSVLFIFSISLVILNASSKRYKYELNKKVAQAEALSTINSIFEETKLLNSLHDKIYRDRIPVQWIMKDISAMIPANIRLDEMLFDNEKRRLMMRGSVEHSGSDDQAVLAEFLNRIEASPLFEKARLISNQRSGSENRLSFYIECSLEDTKGNFYGTVAH